MNKRIVDPRGTYIRQWNNIFLVACLVSLFVDPLFFFLPNVRSKACMEIQRPLNIIVTVMRSITYLFDLFHMFF